MLGQLSSRYKDQRLRETKEQSASRKHQGFSQPQLQQMQQMDFTDGRHSNGESQEHQRDAKKERVNQFLGLI